ncbi:MAG: thermopsin, partial [Candidatus Thermoplasmatota archaeon]|nr:thermopsin [Candidatus Thermoplasmatota archaeon]
MALVFVASSFAVVGGLFPVSPPAATGAVAPSVPAGAATVPSSAGNTVSATGASSSPASGGALGVSSSRADLVHSAEQAFVNDGIPLSDFLPPNLNAAPGPASETGNHIVPLYNYAPAPMGVSTFGLGSANGTVAPYVLNTTSLEGTFSTSDPLGLQAQSLYYGAQEAYGAQLNTVMVNTTIDGQQGFGPSPDAPTGCTGYFHGAQSNWCPNDFWLQNVIQYATSTSTLHFVLNIWNFSTPTGAFPASTILHGNGRIEGHEVYVTRGPSIVVSYPFTLDLYLNTTVGSYQGSPMVNEVYFNYSVYDSAGQHLCPSTEPTGDVCGMYDNVYFNSRANVTPGSAEIEANGYQYNPIGLPTDMEFDYGIGQSSGANANIVYANATVGLYYLDATTHTYRAPPSAYDFGSETGETGIGSLTTWNTVNGQPVAHLRTGPSLLHGLWNTTTLVTANATFATAAAGAYPLNYHDVAPGNAFVAVAPGINTTNQSYFQVAPTFGWFTPGGAIGPNIYLSPGMYTVEVMLSGYNEATTSVNLLSSGQSLNVTLTRSAVPTVYTPLWAYSSSDLANLSVSGSGTAASPYLMPSDQPGSLSPVFAVLNDYFFIVYSGIYLNSTTAHVNFNPPPSLSLTYPTWWYFQLDSRAAAYGATPLTQQLPIYLFHAQNVTIAHAASIGLWSSNVEVRHDFSVYVNDGTNDLFYGDFFNVSSEGLEFLGGGTHDYVWGSTFFPFSDVSAYPGISTPSIGLAVLQNGDWIYNNAFYTNGTATSSATTFRGVVLASYQNFWNDTGGYQSASNYRMVNGFNLTGSILGQKIQGGNYWWNYGSVADPYGVPYVGRTASPTGPAPLGEGADYAPLTPYMPVALAATVPTALGVGLYPVTFTETGLASGATWTARLTGVPVSEPLRQTTYTTNPSNTTVASATVVTNVLYVPNGSYAFTVAATSYDGSPPSGSVTVTGASVGVAVTFTAVPQVSVTASPSSALSASALVTFTVAVTLPSGPSPSGTATLYIAT